MIPKEGLDVKYFLAAFRRRFWYVVIPFFFLSVASIAYCIKAPKIYKSSCVILVQPQEVPTDYVKSTVTTDIKSRLSTITEQVLSRSALEEIINGYDLYPNMRSSGNMYDAIITLRKLIDLKVKQGGDPWSRTPSSFEISYVGLEPTKVKEVTAAIANLYIDHNYRIRAEQAAGTLKFLERELVRMKTVLREKEEAVRTFKEKHWGFLPEQIENNYRLLSQLQQHLDSINVTLQKTEDRKIFLQTQANKLDGLQESPLAAVGEVGEAHTIDDLRRQLRSLQSRYSDKHPDVIKLQAAIARLESDEQFGAPDIEARGSDGSALSSEGQRVFRSQKDDRSAELRLIDNQILSLTNEMKQTQYQIEEYRKRIESGPKIEQMFVDLRRDYEQANQNYQSLLEKKLEAELAENLERTQKGEQFRILDPANLPKEPYKPNILRILAMGCMLALGSGFGLALLREYLDTTFWSKKEIESVLEIPVLASVPVIKTDRERRWGMIKLVASICFLLVMSSTLLYALFILWKRNPTLLKLPI